VSHRPAQRDRLAAAFGHPGVADAYRYRPPYPAEAFDILEQIITDRPRRAAFDQAVADVTAPYAVDGVLDMDIVAHLAWGRPAAVG
jgi:hypothetical protein